jgi:hypothetical protein
MIIIVKAKAIANKSEVISCFIAIAVVNETTTDECTDGIHPLQNERIKSIFPVCTLTAIHFTKTVTKKVIAGISKRF